MKTKKSKMMNAPHIRFLTILMLAVGGTSCSQITEETKHAAELANSHVVPVAPSLFSSEALVGDIVKEERTLADGIKALCYVIRTYSEPLDHAMGPWAPKTITDGKEAGGIWFRSGEVYNVDGPFIKNMAAFYDDTEWKLYNDDGTVRVTDTKEAFEAAARPDVDPRYNNYVVEGRPEWFGHKVTTYVIPVEPVYQSRPSRLGHGGVGIAFDGVKFDPPAPVENIIDAHTIAPFDHAGGHINPHEGYHYHAATGRTKEVAQPDGHAPMIGYALDGFGIFAHLDPVGNAPVALDECGGHYDGTRGYHYHAGSPGSNQIIGAFRGQAGTVTVEH
ncbi:MAG: YHYH protein [Flavobacteriales bacterium]|jgi:hypothetical protein|nr:YHYH protein [Flavobacteriales bacterium]